MPYIQEESGIIWNRATTSTVEVAFVGSEVWFRNSETKDVILKYTTDEWRAFIGGVKDGEFDF